jgi:hypothetical protein
MEVYQRHARVRWRKGRLEIPRSTDELRSGRRACGEKLTLFAAPRQSIFTLDSIVEYQHCRGYRRSMPIAAATSSASLRLLGRVILCATKDWKRLNVSGYSIDISKL